MKIARNGSLFTESYVQQNAYLLLNEQTHGEKGVRLFIDKMIFSAWSAICNKAILR
ncbi:hypothetical protein [Falsiporphyromonas endometrii]|uniref:Uncharacterized protein n=1 Tax=Falsiporphyromonas endometrii TaxID=1387297 RepID=A0ABV9K5J7_9PORP